MLELRHARKEISGLKFRWYMSPSSRWKCHYSEDSNRNLHRHKNLVSFWYIIEDEHHQCHEGKNGFLLHQDVCFFPPSPLLIEIPIFLRELKLNYSYQHEGSVLASKGTSYL
jgi:hypothetical protein